MNPAALSDRLLDFSARVGKVVDALPRERLANHIASELVRCGTAPGSHYEEGCGAESRADFLHKLRLALKELRESGYWLRLGSVWKLLFRRLRELRKSGRTTSSPFAMEGSRIKRHQLTDEPWELIADLFPPPASTGRPPADRRMMVDAILWIMHSGAAWRDLPEDEFCPWETVYGLFNAWNEDGKLDEILGRLQTSFVDAGEIDDKLWCIDGMIVRAHQCAAGGGKKTTPRSRMITH